MSHSLSTASVSANFPTNKLPLNERYQQTRQLSEQLCQPLATEDYVIQSMPDVSPPKWHLAHTTWFFETFLLVPFLADYAVFNAEFGYLFNSYYETVGQRHPRSQRGLLSRPTVEQVYQYRAFVDEAMQRLLTQTLEPAVESLVVLGLHHEQQHQELLLTDIKHILAVNPLRPAYQANLPVMDVETASQERWLDYPGGLYAIGYEADFAAEFASKLAFSSPAFDSKFAFDNESPRHQVYLQDYWLASRLVTNGEYLEFIQADGYQTPDYWLSAGWAIVQAEQWRSPLYWEQQAGDWQVMTLGGMRPLNEHEPVCHVSYYEADAYARWAGKRLPTEAEWEVAATQVAMQGNFVDRGRFHPAPATGETRPDQLFGDVWEWTQSAYLPYPGFQAAPGAVGEYNGKFMCNQMVLRGGSCATSQSHIRPSYRNFFPPETRWQFSGIRLAR